MIFDVTPTGTIAYIIFKVSVNRMFWLEETNTLYPEISLLPSIVLRMFLTTFWYFFISISARYPVFGFTNTGEFK